MATRLAFKSHAKSSYEYDMEKQECSASRVDQYPRLLASLRLAHTTELIGVSQARCSPCKQQKEADLLKMLTMDASTYRYAMSLL